MCIVYIVFIMYFQQFIGNILSHILIQNTETIELVIDKIVKSRSLITSGQANIEINRIDSENGKHIDTKTKLKIWFDINHYRVDYIQEGDRMSFSDVGYEKVFCSNCEKEGHYISAVRGPFWATLAKLDNIGKMSLLKSGIDLRCLGVFHIFYPNLMPRSDDIKSELAKNLLSEEYHNYSMSKDPVDGKYLITSIHRKSGAARVVMIDPQKNYFVSSISVQRKENADRYESRTTLENIEHVLPDLWYAKSIKYEHYTNGKLEFAEYFTVTDLVINQPIPSSVFTLAGIGLTNGKIIRTPDNKQGNLMIQDGKIVPRSLKTSSEKIAQPLPESVPDPIPIIPPTSPRWPYTLGAGIFAILTVYFLRRLIISRTG